VPRDPAQARDFRRLLVARPADAANLNAQAKNAQHIVAAWTSTDWRPSILAFGPPAPGVAANRNVDLVRIKPDRLWRARVTRTYLQPFDAVFAPGVHHMADWAGLTLRRLLGRKIAVIETVEGLLAAKGDATRARLYSEAAGHPVFCQQIGAAHFARIEAIARDADHIIAISPFLARMTRQVRGDKVSVLPLGVDTALFRPTGGPPRERLRIAGAGGVNTHKRPELFVAMAQRFPEADFVWFGEGPMRAPLRAEAERLGLANLAFPGAVDPARLAAEFGVSDIFVLPSLSEGVPKVTQEAAAAGLAQIVFGFYEAPTVEDGRNGYVVWNDDELFHRLQEMLSRRELVVEMGRSGEEMARDWSWDIVAPLWEKRIRQVLD
jgi:glycosyltransferase involved in cell wall biosynthesis